MQNQKQPKNQNPPPNPKPNKNPPPDQDFNLRETSPDLAGRRFSGSQRPPTTYDLVEQMDYLYVRVVKAKELPPKDPAAANTAISPLVEIRLGNSKCKTNHLESNPNPEFNRVFAFLKDRIQSTSVDILVKDKGMDADNFLGKIMFEISDVPKRVPPDSPLAPQWYRLENPSGHRGTGELMLAVWIGTQADEVFPEASHLDAEGVTGDGITNIRSKVYLSPKLWYLRVNVIEAQDLQANDKNREVLVKVVLGNVVMKTRVFEIKNVNNPMWNEDLMFVAAEPFDETLILSVETKLGPNKEETLGMTRVSLQSVDRRLECDSVGTRWYNLEKHFPVDCEQKQEVKIVGRISARISLDGGYHVLDELTQYSSDFRATAGPVGKPGIGILELGILGAKGLTSMKTKDGRGMTDAYCVAKYGQKWIRTRTIIDSCNPKWNEQYTWEVYDTCTVITLVVFDNGHLCGVGGNNVGPTDSKIGKIRIRLSALETGRVYTHSYPLIVLQNSGVKKMGELQLAVRFSCSSFMNMVQMYALPLLPKMHYLRPLSIFQQDSLRFQATQAIAARMGRAEPPLRKEVVEYVLDVGSHMWSMRKSKANIGRIATVVSGLVVVFKWADWICSWKNPFMTAVVHFLCLLMIMEPKLILSAVLLSFFMLGVVNFRSRPRAPPHMDAKLSYADMASSDELDEEFDTFPCSKGGDQVKVRYDRLRCIAARMQSLLGDMATQGERFCALVSWRDPRATGIFTIFCLAAAVGLFFVPIKLVFVVAVFYVMRHPRFRNNLPSLPFNFFRRLPSRADSLL